MKELLLQLNIDSQEVLAEYYSINFLLRNRECKNFNDDLNTKV